MTGSLVWAPVARGASSALRIGLLSQSSGSGAEVLVGAERAIAEANEAGGVGGRPVELVVLPRSRPWLGVAGPTARLVAEQTPAALIGPLDGSAAHVGAQIATRTQTPLLTLASEKSLTEAFSPWVFQGVPNDARQARRLLLDALSEPRGKQAAIVVPAGRTGTERRAALETVCRDLGLRYETLTGRDSVLRSSTDVLLLWLEPDDASNWVARQARERLPDRILVPHWLADEVFLEALPPWVTGLSGPQLRPAAGASTTSALAYDLTSLAIAALRRAGPDRLRVPEFLANAEPYSGLSGTFSFDRRGARVGTYPVVAVERANTARRTHR